MRTDNSIKNAKFATLMTIVSIGVGFVLQKVFIMTLGNEYLGLNGLFSNILSILSVVELGFSNAIIFNLYGPIARGEKEKAASLVSFYKKVYQIIGIIILAIGIAFLPFVGFFVGETSITENIYIFFFLALIDTVSSFFLAYRRSIIMADQKAFVINLVHTSYIIIMNALQIAFLFLCHNFLIFLIIKIISRIAENVVINAYAKKKYPHIRDLHNVSHIDEETNRNIKKQIKGLFFHKIASALVLSTDNLLISKLFGVVYVGLYANYYLIINAINELFSQVFMSITASIGNLLVKESKEKAYATYKDMLYVNSWLYTFAGAAILCCIQPFIKIWLGEEFQLAWLVLITLVVNFYFQGMRKTNGRFKEAAGIYYEDRFAPIIEAVINLGASIIFAKLFGLAGIFMGTIVSSLVLFLYSYPVVMYKRIFNHSYWEFIKIHFAYLSVAVISIFASFALTSLINTRIDNSWLQIVTSGIICLIIPTVIYVLVGHYNGSLVFIKGILRKTIKKNR